MLNQYGKGNYFGLKEMVKDEPIRRTTMVCQSAVGQVVHIPKKYFVNIVCANKVMRNHVLQEYSLQLDKQKWQGKKAIKFYKKYKKILFQPSKASLWYDEKVYLKEKEWVNRKAYVPKGYKQNHALSYVRGLSEDPVVPIMSRTLDMPE